MLLMAEKLNSERVGKRPEKWACPLFWCRALLTQQVSILTLITYKYCQAGRSFLPATFIGIEPKNRIVNVSESAQESALGEI